MTIPKVSSNEDSPSAADNRFVIAGTKQFSPRALQDFGLIQRFLFQQEEKAYAELVEYYRRPLFNLIQRMVSQTAVAEDLTMEVLARAYHYLPGFQPVFAFSTWLFRIATNHSIDFLRLRRLQTVSLHAAIAVANGEELGFFELPDADPTPQEALIRTQRTDYLRRAVAQLPPKYRRALELHYFEELSYAEIVAQHGLTLVTVKSRMHRGRALLAQQLAHTLSSI